MLINDAKKNKQLAIAITIAMSSTIAIAHENDSSSHRLGDQDTNFKSYRPSYFGFRTNHSNEDHEGEVKFQLSLKYQLTKDDINESMPLVNAVTSNWYFGYTQKSFWSVQRDSEPFRENNFSPEFFKEIRYSSWMLRFGLYRHESTGEDGEGSHGWNTTYLEPVMKFGNFTFAPKLWAPVFFREKEKAAPDNPDIFDYYGHGELKFAYENPGHYKHSLMYRQGKNSDIYGFRWQSDFDINIFDWTPKIFFQYWDGYGESLKDYNNKTHGVVLGLSAVH